MSTLKKYTLPQMLQDSFCKFADNPSLQFIDHPTLTYAELEQQVKQVGNQLRLLDLGIDDKIAILGTNTPNWGVSFFATSCVGATAVPILPDFTPKEVYTILEHSEATALFVSEKLFASVSQLLPENIKYLISLENFSCLPLDATVPDFQASKAPILSAEGFTYTDVDEESLLSIIYTSGTTGKSKGVMLTHKNILWTSETGLKIQPMIASDRLISLLPLSHTLENTLGLVMPIMQGASVYYMTKPPTPSVLLPALQKVKPTIMLTVPLIIEKIYRGKILPQINKSPITRNLYKVGLFRKILNRIAGKKLYQTFGGHLHFFGIGGAKLDQTVEQFLRDAKFPYAIGYGLTETSPLLAGAIVGKTILGSTGPAFPEVELRISEPNAKTGEGEVQARGQNVMKGYFKAPELTKEVFTKDGWFKTGDLGILDKNGFLFIKGRIKNMIVGASGENIYPEEIETVINKMEFVLESLVTKKGGKLVAMVHLNMEELETRFKKLQENAKTLKAEAQNAREEAKNYLQERVEELLPEIKKMVNAEVNKFSQIQQVILQTVPFEKTPTQKIKRFLYA